MKTFLIFIMTLLNIQSNHTYNFENDNLKWTVINDGVMGGVSSSDFKIIDGVGIFEGNVSLDNNGGFASVRTTLKDEISTKSSKVTLLVKGDGKKYKFRIRTNDNFDGIAYSAEFQTKNNQAWEKIELPFTVFKATLRGYIINDAPKIIPKKIKQIGFLIGNKKTESFKLEIDWIKFNKS